MILDLYMSYLLYKQAEEEKKANDIIRKRVEVFISYEYLGFIFNNVLRYCHKVMKN